MSFDLHFISTSCDIWPYFVFSRKSTNYSNAGVPQGSILGPTLFLLHINGHPGDVIRNTAIYTNDTTLYSKCDQSSDLIYKKLWNGVQSGLLISMLEKPNLLCLTSLITLVLLMWKWMGGFSSKFYWDSYIISIAKTASMKIRTLVCSVKFHSPEVALYLYNSVPIKGLRFVNCESFLDFHESLFENILILTKWFTKNCI